MTLAYIYTWFTTTLHFELLTGSTGGVTSESINLRLATVMRTTLVCTLHKRRDESLVHTLTALLPLIKAIQITAVAGEKGK